MTYKKLDLSDYFQVSPKKEEPKQVKKDYVNSFKPLEPKTDPLTPSTVSQLPGEQEKAQGSIFEILKKLRKTLAIPSEMSKEGLTKLAEFIPDPEIKSQTYVHEPTNENFEVSSGGTIKQVPKVAESGSGVIKKVPRLVADLTAEFAPDFIHPDVLLFAGAAKGTGMALKSKLGQETLSKVGKLTDDYIPNFKKWFTYRYGQDPKYVEAMEQADIDNRLGIEKVGNLTKDLLEMPANTQRKIGIYLKGNKHIKLDPKEQIIAESVREEFKIAGRDLVDLGMLDEKTYLDNIETYLPRLYKTKEGIRSTFGTRKPLRMNVDRLKHRTDIPQELREAMGEIHEAGYLSSKGLMQMQSAIAKARAFDRVSKMPHIVTNKEAIGLEKGWTQLPVDKKLGKLSGNWVEPTVAEDLSHVASDRNSNWSKWLKILGAWKMGKVTLSPTTHFRNMFTNSFWLDVSGTGWAKQARLFPKAFKELTDKGLFYKAAQKEGLIGTEMIGQDIVRLQEKFIKGADKPSISNLLGRSVNYAKRAVNKAGDIYQGEEQLFKLVKYMDNLSKGMKSKAAALDAENVIFNYNKISPAVKVLRETAVPFVTYFSKAIPALGRAAITNPMALYKYVGMFDAMEKTTMKREGLDKGQVKAIKDYYDVNVIPSLTKPKDGKVRTLDIDFLTPWGEATQLSASGIPQPLAPSGPLFSLINLLSNHDPYTRKPIFNPEDPTELKVKAATDYLGKAMLPNLTPGVPGLRSGFRGGYHAQDLTDALRGKVRYPKTGEAKSVPEALISTMLGLKTKKVNPDIAKSGMISIIDQKIQNIEREFDRRMKNGENLTTKEKDWLIKEVFPNATQKQLLEIKKYTAQGIQKTKPEAPKNLPLPGKIPPHILKKLGLK